MDLEKYKNFTISFEIEMETDDEYINIPKEYFTTMQPYGFQKESKEKKIIENKRTYAKNKVKTHLPYFYDKYNNVVNFTFDRTLTNGIEISNKTYCNGIYEAIELITDFFEDFSKQDFWKMNLNTSIQYNIGVLNNDKWNIERGILEIDDEYVFKDIQKERRNKYKNLLENIDLKEDITQQIIEKTKKYGGKAFNINIDRIIKNNYAEFRYIGGKLNMDIVKEKLFYFCHIVDIMTK